MSLEPGSSDAKLPSEIDGYRIQRILGTGGMATVYAALQTQPRRIVALKVIKRGLESKSALHRFTREVEILGKLRHPNIAQVFHAGTYDDGSGPAPYFVMEYIPGAKTIHQFAASRDLSLRDRLKIFVRTCAAVDHGHKNKVIHRDLKPSNMLVDESGVAKVIDFGIARSIDATSDDRTVQTEAGDLVGTIHYMAPEQLRNELVDLDPRCDVYALGAVLYKLLTGKPPYQLAGLPLPTAALVVMEDEPVPPSLYKPELKGDLETILLKALEKDRERRYRSAGSLGRDIIRFLNNQPIQARPANVWHKSRLFVRRHRTAVIATVISSIAVLGAGAAVIYSSHRSAQIGRDALTHIDNERKALNASRDRLNESVMTDVVPEVERPPIHLSIHREVVNRIVFSPSGLLFAAGSDDQRISVCETESGRTVLAAHEHDASIISVSLSHESTITSVAADGSITRLDVAQQSLLGRKDLNVNVNDAAISADGNIVAVAGDDLTVRVWDRAAEAERTLRGTRGAFNQVMVSADGDLIAAASASGSVYVWNRQGAEVRRVDDLAGRVIAIGISNDGGHIVVVHADGDGMMYSLDVDASIGIPFDAHRERVLAAAVDPMGQYAVTASEKSVVVVELATRAIVADEIESSPDVSSVAISSDGRSVGIGFNDGSIIVHPVILKTAESK